MLDLLPYLDFRNNPFNLLGLSVQAGPKEIRHRREDIEAALETGTPLEEFDKSKFPTNEPDDIRSAIAEAFAKLEDPKERFIHSVFWFWPLKRGTDDYLLKCAAGGSEEGLNWAMSGWKRDEYFSRCEQLTALHNLAIANLWLAERGDKGLSSISTSLPGGIQVPQPGNSIVEEPDDYWRESFSLLSEFSRNDAFRDLLERIVDEWKDPRIPRSIARHIQYGIPASFCRLRLCFAEQLAISGLSMQAERHMSFLRENHDWDVDVGGMIDDRVSEIQNQVEQLLGTCWQEDRKLTGLTSCRTILARTRSPIMVVSTLLGLEDSRTVAFRDNIANHLRAIIFDYAEASGDYRNGVLILEKARSIASTEKMRGWIESETIIFKNKDPGLRFGAIRENTKKLFDSIQPVQRLSDGVNVCLRVIRETKPWLDYVRNAIDLDYRAVLEYCDWIAWFLKETICLYGDASKEYLICVEILEKASRIAGSSNMKRQIESEKDRFSNATFATDCFVRNHSGADDKNVPRKTLDSTSDNPSRQNESSCSASSKKRNPFVRLLKAVEAIILFAVENIISLLVLIGVILYVGSCIHSEIQKERERERVRQARQIEARKEMERKTAEQARQAAEREAERERWASRRQATPPSGTVHMLVDAECDSSLRIETKSGANHLVKLVSWRGKKPIETIFVRGGKTVEVAVPSGRYELRFASGLTWYGDEYLFGPGMKCSKADQVFSFTPESGYTVTLYEVENGNLQTSGLSLEDF